MTAPSDPPSGRKSTGQSTLKQKDRTTERLYDYWILGHGATERPPRWSVIRDVLHWVE